MARVLLVDDSATIRETIGQYLLSSGHEVIEASDGNQALKAARTWFFELINSTIVQGFSMKSAAPLAKTRSLASALLLAVNMSTGVLVV